MIITNCDSTDGHIFFCAGHFESDLKTLEKDNKQKEVDKTTERKLNIYRLGLRFVLDLFDLFISSFFRAF